jgi:hypothetical protein
MRGNQEENDENLIQAKKWEMREIAKFQHS